jgi:hypothetical protein
MRSSQLSLQPCWMFCSEHVPVPAVLSSAASFRGVAPDRVAGGPPITHSGSTWKKSSPQNLVPQNPGSISLSLSKFFRNTGSRFHNGNMESNTSRKRSNGHTAESMGTSKKARFMDDNSSESSDDDGGVTLNINEDYARRFEHNKKRTELMQCM